MRKEDLPFIRLIECRCFLDPWPSVCFSQAIDEKGICWSVVLGDKVIGYLVAFKDKNYIHLANIAIDQPYRRLNIASNLINLLIEQAHQSKIKYIKLEVRPSNIAAISLYRKFGFRKFRTIPNYYKNGEDAYIYILKIL